MNEVKTLAVDFDWEGAYEEIRQRSVRRPREVDTMTQEREK